MLEDSLFNQWNIQKQNIQKSSPEVYFHERDVFFIHMGKNVGCEQDGKGNGFKRPVIIIKKFNNDSFLGVPLTSQNKSGLFYFPFSIENKGLQTATLSQIKLFSSKRLINKIGKISTTDFRILIKKIKDLL